MSVRFTLPLVLREIFVGVVRARGGEGVLVNLKKIMKEGWDKTVHEIVVGLCFNTFSIAWYGQQCLHILSCWHVLSHWHQHGMSWIFQQFFILIILTFLLLSFPFVFLIFIYLFILSVFW